MATSSIYTSVKIKKKSECQKLVNALEHAERNKAKAVEYTRQVEVMKGEKIRELFK
ncbi:MAG: hypothetical protein IJM42_05290 [Synergistes sp.]|nr:hypothetical protein [Synergistes sp.]